MTSPAAVAAHILSLVPAPLPSLDLDRLPALQPLAPLAEVIGADPTPLLRAAETLAQDRDAIVSQTVRAAGMVAAAGAELIQIVSRLQARAAALLPLLATPVTAPGAIAQLAAAAVEALGSAALCLIQLEHDLAGPARELLSVVARAAATPGVAAHPATRAATRELEALAESAGIEVRPHSAGSPNDPNHALSAPVGNAGGNTAEGSEVGEAAVAAARSQIGSPYAWGGTGPGGFDCSGLTSWAYHQAGVDLPRMAHEQAVGRQVSYEELQPGDLAVWDGHVAMYAGDGMYVEAGDPVQLNPVRTDNMGMTFRGFWRPTG